MKKNLLFSTVLCLASLAFPVSSNASPYCSCAGRCATGSTCNCSTGSCTIPARYAYGYVDTVAPVVYTQPEYPVYRAATPYRTSEPARKYAPLRAAPYMAVRVAMHSLEGEVKYTSAVQNDPTKGGKWEKDFDDDVFSGSLAFGMKKNNWRAELEGSIYSEAEKKVDFAIGNPYTSNPFTAKVQINTLLFNLFYDFPTNTPLTPFIGAGVGLSYIKGKYNTVDTDGNNSESHKKVDLAWQVGAGVSYALSGTVNLDFAYRYTHFGKAKLQSFSGCEVELGEYASDSHVVKDLNSHSLSAGIRFSF